nr:hypothetical protein [Tanacetum cinerariifolium]
MMFEEVEAKFNSVWKQMKDFIPMGSKEEAKRIKRKAIVLARGAAEVPTDSGSIPTAGPSAVEVPTGSDVVPTASPVFATATVITPYRRRKGKEVM